MAGTTIFMPPAAVLVRTIRPYLSFCVVTGIVLFHIVRSTSDEGTATVSLRALLWEGFNQVTDRLNGLAYHYGRNDGTHDDTIDSVFAVSLSFLYSILSRAWSLVLDLATVLMLTSSLRVLYCLTQYERKEWTDALLQRCFDWARVNLSIMKKGIADLHNETKRELQHTLKRDPNRTIMSVLPQQGIDASVLVHQLQSEGDSQDKTWREGKISGTVYAVSPSHTELMNAAYAAFSWSNPLHAGVWPSVNTMEAETITMTANMLGKQQTVDNVCGAMTSGGTESILLAIKSHLVYYGRFRSIEHPELICCSTAHASVDKACELMGIRKVVVPADPVTFTLDPARVVRHVTANTIMIYSSAPCYPQGVIDPIAELSKVAKRFDIGLHVDACLGGFVLPFARSIGRNDIPPFDFAVPGVTSMSVDTHKYGLASKGTSVVLYRFPELRHCQYFSYSKWSGGLYSTPTMAGSRSGAIVACAWAALVSTGETGYIANTRKILEATRRMADGIAALDDVELCGQQTPTMIVAFQSKTIDIYRLGDHMKEKGWSLHALQYPPCLHLCVTLNSAPNADRFVSDLAVSVQETRKEGAIGKTKGSAAIYGAVDKLPTGPADEMLRAYTDMTLTI